MLSEKKSSDNLYIWTLALLITGTTVGAGILGLPIKTGLSGFLPSILVGPEKPRF